MNTTLTEQEKFWAGEFGNAYAERNSGNDFIKTNIHFFSNLFKKIEKPKRILELGCNIGLNLEAIHFLFPEIKLTGVEINQNAVDVLKQKNIAEVIQGSILGELKFPEQFDLVFTRGVLIHINPEHLSKVYDHMFNLSRRYIIVFEYYNPKPVEIPYRGHTEKLFKRDFAGELMDKYPLRLIDYGFVYHRDPYFPQDDGTWFILEKTGSK
jgi:pseudaminic acid biosynthesis-associated methylase